VTSPATKLQASRRRAGLSQAALARAAGCHASTVRRIERGSSPGLRVAIAIAKLTGGAVSVDSLVRT